MNNTTGEPRYDTEPVNKAYVDRLIGGVEETVATYSKTYGAAPTPPYFVNDTYVDGTNLYIAIKDRLIGVFTATDWELATEYITETLASETYTKPADFAETGAVVVHGGRIQAGSVTSEHYVPDTTGMTINLDNDTIDSKHFKVDNTGAITATKGFIGTWTLDDEKLYNGIEIGTANSCGIGTGNTLDDWQFWAGNGAFKVSKEGFLTASAANITGTITTSDISVQGGSLAIGGRFNVDSAGNLVAHNANISGIITATSGSFTGAINATSGSFTGSVTGATISGGSISITKSGGYYFNMGTSTSHPNASGLNVGWGGINVNGLGFNSDGYSWTFSGDLKASNITSLYNLTMNGTLTSYGSIKTNYITPSGSLNLKTANASGVASGAGILIRAGTGNVTIDCNGNTSYGVYCSGKGLSNSLIVTNSGSASSMNVKENIIEFKNEYKEVIEILNNMNIYSYDYKYNLYNNKHQYGFIIDELRQNPETNKYFDFKEEEAYVDDDKLNFQIDNDVSEKEKITVMKYNPDALDKYLLTVCKAQQMQINVLMERVTSLEKEMKENVSNR